MSAATGVPADLLSGDTEEACTAQAQAILKFAKPGYPNVRDGGDPHHTPTGSTRQQFADWFEQVTCKGEIFYNGSNRYQPHYHHHPAR